MEHSLGNIFLLRPPVAKVDTYTLAVMANFAASYRPDREFARQAVQQLLEARVRKRRTGRAGCGRDEYLGNRPSGPCGEASRECEETPCKE
jgi:hypothetical protein